MGHPKAVPWPNPTPVDRFSGIRGRPSPHAWRRPARRSPEREPRRRDRPRPALRPRARRRFGRLPGRRSRVPSDRAAGFRRAPREFCRIGRRRRCQLIPSQGPGRLVRLRRAAGKYSSGSPSASRSAGRQPPSGARPQARVQHGDRSSGTRSSDLGATPNRTLVHGYLAIQWHLSFYPARGYYGYGYYPLLSVLTHLLLSVRPFGVGVRLVRRIRCIRPMRLLWERLRPIRRIWRILVEGSHGPSHATGSIRLKVNPDSASVYVDGTLVGKATDFDGLTAVIIWSSRAASHLIEISGADGYETYSTRR